jgi:hypothetical protein
MVTKVSELYTDSFVITEERNPGDSIEMYRSLFERQMIELFLKNVLE